MLLVSGRVKWDKQPINWCSPDFWTINSNYAKFEVNLEIFQVTFWMVNINLTPPKTNMEPENDGF